MLAELSANIGRCNRKCSPIH